MHLKNWSFIYRDGRTPELAPAYDYLCTKICLKHNQTGLALGSARQFPQVTIEQFKHLAKRASVSTGVVAQAAHDMVGRMHAVWPDVRGTLPFQALRETIEAQFETVPLFKPSAPAAAIDALFPEPHEEIA